MNDVQVDRVPGADERSAALLARLVRLLEEVEELNRQLERVEAEMQEALSRAARDRFEEYC
jgi:molecular chaperone GrpE (heat shock protein)